MSTFAVFGVTLHSITKKLNEVGLYGSEAKKAAEEKFPTAKPKRISELFDAPQFCEEFIEIIRRTDKSKQLSIRSYGPMKDASGSVILNKKTGKPRMGFTVFKEFA